MIYCPGCGTANREGSRFCNECGKRLSGEAAERCPRCGGSNLPDAVHCEACGLDLARARAAARSNAPAPEVSAEPAEAPPEEEESAERDAGLPPWLDSAEASSTQGVPRREALDDLDELASEAKAQPRPGGWSPEAIPIEPIVGVPYRAYERVQLPQTPEQEKAAALFAGAAAEEVHAAPREVLEARRPTGPTPAARRLLAAALLLALLLPMLWPLAPFDAAPAASAAVAGAARAIDGLPAGAPVLVAFDYDAGVAGDLQPVAEALLCHLFSLHDLRVFVVSTQPEGADLASLALDHALAATSAAGGHPSVVHLGYVAGDEAAVRTMALSLPAVASTDYRTGVALATTSALRGVAGAGELPLIVVLSRDLGTLRRWVEQTAAPYGTQVIAGLPTLAGPAAGPYYAAGQLCGVVAGIGDAAAYEDLRGAAQEAGAGPGLRSLAGVRLGAWVLAAAVLAANVWALVEWMRGRRVRRDA